jgi:adenylosuccinate synthase
MEQEITLKIIAQRSGISLSELNRVERTSTTNRDRRIAEFDWTDITHDWWTPRSGVC